MALASCRLIGCLGLSGALTTLTPVRAQQLDLNEAQLVDLTHAYSDKTLTWPTSKGGFVLEKLSYGKTDAGYFYSAFAFCTPEHAGTHLDAPIHFAEGGEANDQIPLRRMIGAAAVIDVAKQATANRDYRLSRDDVLLWEKAHGPLAPGTIVLVRTGWSRHWPDRLAYLGDDTPGDGSKLRFPGYGDDAARLLVEERQVALLGIDTASIDYGPSKDFTVHRLAAARNVPALENLTNLDRLPPRGATVIALPMKIAGGSGGPVRVIAIVSRPSRQNKPSAS